eukprot:1147494-Pelagomonas_calceolata.AAC.1
MTAIVQVHWTASGGLQQSLSQPAKESSIASNKAFHSQQKNPSLLTIRPSIAVAKSSTATIVILGQRGALKDGEALRTCPCSQDTHV